MNWSDGFSLSPLNQPTLCSQRVLPVQRWKAAQKRCSSHSDHLSRGRYVYLQWPTIRETEHIAQAFPSKFQQCSLPSLGKVTIHPRSSKASFWYLKTSDHFGLLHPSPPPGPTEKVPRVRHLVIDAPAVPRPAARRCWRPLTMPSRFPQAAPEG